MTTCVRIAVCSTLMLLALAPSSARACKYSVRDVGFVDIHSSPYQLVLVFDETTDAATVQDLQRRGRVALTDSNVALVAVNLSREPAHPLLKHLPTLDRQSLPRLWMMAPDQRIAPVRLPRTREGAVDGDRLQSELSSAMESPIRQEIREHVATGLCVILLLEGTEASSNRRARETARQVIEQIKQVISRLEKPTKDGPLLLTVPVEDRERERWTLWSLGEEFAPSPTARMAILFGRFHPMGSVLDVARLSRTELFSKAATLGRSCECSLDRTRLYGMALLHRWDQPQRERVAKSLTFDPEDPLVKAEIGAILAKPPLPEGQRRGASQTLTFEELLLGYREQSIDDDIPTTMPLAPTRESPSPTAAAEPRSEVDPSLGGEKSLPHRLIFTLVGVMGFSVVAAGWVVLRARKRGMRS